MYEIVYTKRALQALPKLKAAKLGGKVEALVALLERDPFQNPPPYESLLGTLKGAIRAASPQAPAGLSGVRGKKDGEDYQHVVTL